MACLYRKIGFGILYIFLFYFSNAQKKFVFEQSKMGSPFTITIFTDDSVKAATTANKAFELADSLNFILSDYIDSSEINRLSASSGSNKYVAVSTILFNVIAQSQYAAQTSNGAFDITVGPVIKLWRHARKENAFPDKHSLSDALNKTGYQYLHIDTIHKSIMLEKKGMQLDVGGIGKGFVAQAALNFISASGLTSAMISAGGSIVTSNAPGNKNWLIAINEPEKEALMPEMLSLQNMSVSTSGDMYQFVEFNGKKYSHIVNPKTGLGLTQQRNVTVIATDGATSDWLSTACSVFSVKQSMKLIKHIKGAALLITANRHGKIKKKSSPLFKTYYF